MFPRSHFLQVALVLALGACTKPAAQDQRAETARAFPLPDRPVSRASSKFSSETDRDRLNEANVVMDLTGIAPGMSVADLGAGEGYYTVRLAQRVGKKGRVLAEDIDSRASEQLGTRVLRERLENVSIKLGMPDDPSLPQNSFDRILLIHMYHEVSEPYAFLWRMRPALRPGGKVVVVDVDRPTNAHGTPPDLLFCELSAVGFRLTQFVRKRQLQGYYAQFEAVGPRPEPPQIRPCRNTGGTRATVS
ncbi:generic methyltransferase [Novosphingobium sp. Rr 2-17]|uniref:class I SAM-dependent methyltransferase n=1 Tax=Novosphingobium sp. Rr 2-17 TaxID=555793 RepID=UPI0002697E7E|nr:class I SAM-dependent methyltransferase [Novosphingobium sp. Rr 2-17]EIZ80250.1 generic methyltransferase [Novosphingobium sp. Rr 2-17]